MIHLWKRCLDTNCFLFFFFLPGIFFSDLPTLEGRTALMVACSTGNKHMVASLIDYSMQLAQRRAARDKDAQYGSLVRVLGHEIAAQARYSEAGT